MGKLNRKLNRLNVIVKGMTYVNISLERFPPLNSFCTLVRKLFKFSLHKRKTNAENI
jgi:hypothetical protein